MKKTKIIVIVAALFIIATSLSYPIYRAIIKNVIAKQKAKASLLARRKAAWEQLKKTIENELTNLRGEAGIVIKDLDMGWEISSNEDKPTPAASIVKIPIMLSYFYMSSEGKVNLKDTIVCKRSDKTPGSGVLKNAPAGSALSIEDLIYLMITESDNTAANMLIDLRGLSELNSYFKRIGLKDTNLSRKMMDFTFRKEGVENYTTAKDMAYLLEKIYRGMFINGEISKKCIRLLASQKINDRIPKRLPANTIVAHKTGLEKGVCHDVGIVYTSKGNFLISVLIKHEYRFAREAKRHIARISLAAYNYYNGF